ncbi:MFS transporter [Rhodococcus sp. 06-156-3C]|uniref:MFS transporter n=1 Tax=Nocardiaceae TaxID=85025 RepID=UPI0005230F2E|nr:MULTISPECIES: MFS transporter [Rhodococcus]OZD14756.1 MFS transporter [Rhodococcus sp. 06-156-4C]OZD20168.1 MFS transporter [Rhodococcus sp. 06-156-4a]OZD22528.1 MFS transporter [Rhodococcus sp. 06-156-3C]OZD26186.1 MFS transporter [Rhodococcus sp. 06-156-3b]OZD38393.1 MFS transporter [Rhodococcus sp. 06-156-3]
MSELTKRHRYLVLAICCMSLFLVSIDNTIVNVALPAIGSDLRASVSGLQWIIDAYTLVLASLLMLGGSSADRFGRKKFFMIGTALFIAGSLLCSVAPSLGWLVAFRMVQAVGGSMMNPVAMSIITNTFTDPKERAGAIGVWGGVVGISMAGGPLIGGALVTSAGWESIFWVNVPIGLIALFMTWKFVPESKAAHARRFDPAGQVLMIVLLASVVFTIIEMPTKGWSSPTILATATIAVASLLGFLYVETHRTEPLVELSFFRSVPFSGATVIAVCAFGSLGGFLFLNTLYLQDVRGYSPLHAGLYTLPMALMTLILAPISGRLTGSRGPRTSLVVAGVGFIVSSLMLTQLTATTSFAWLALPYLVFGIGFGMVNAPITNTAVSGMPRSQAGVASAVASTSRQVGQSLGVAVVGSIVTAGLVGTFADGFVDAARSAWVVMTGAGIIVLALAFVTTGSWARGTAERVADRSSELVA